MCWITHPEHRLSTLLRVAAAGADAGAGAGAGVAGRRAVVALSSSCRRLSLGCPRGCLRLSSGCRRAVSGLHAGCVEAPPRRRRRFCCCCCRCSCASPGSRVRVESKECRSRACMGNTRPGTVPHSSRGVLSVRRPERPFSSRARQLRRPSTPSARPPPPHSTPRPPCTRRACSHAPAATHERRRLHRQRQWRMREKVQNRNRCEGGAGRGLRTHIFVAFDPELSGNPELGVKVGLHHIRFQHLGARRICTRCDTMRHIQSALANGSIGFVAREHTPSS